MLKPTRTPTAEEFWLHGVWEDSRMRDSTGWSGTQCFSCARTIVRGRQWLEFAKTNLDADGKGKTGLCPRCGLDTLFETDKGQKAVRLAHRHWLGPEGLQEWPSALERSADSWKVALRHQQQFLAQSVKAGERLYRRYRIRWDIEGSPPFTGARGPIPLGWEPVVDRLLGELVAAGWSRRLLRCRPLFDGFDFHAVTLPPAARGIVRRAHRELGRRCHACGKKGERRSRDDAFEDSRRDAELNDGLGGAQILCDACWLEEPLWPAEQARWIAEAAMHWSYIWGQQFEEPRPAPRHRHLLYSVRLSTGRKEEVEAFLLRLLRATSTHAASVEPPSLVRGAFRSGKPEEERRALNELRKFLRSEDLVVEMANGVRRLPA